MADSSALGGQMSQATEAPRGQQDQRKTTWKDTVQVILELSLRRNKGQPTDTVMKSTSLRLKTPDDH